MAVCAIWGLVALGLIRVVPQPPAVKPEFNNSPATVRDGLVVPVAGVERASLRSNWLDPRDGGARQHHGLDIAAPGGTPVVAAAAGTVEKLWQSAQGGTTLYVRSPTRDRIYYYAHLAGYAPGVREGTVVRAGTPLGYVGDTGNAGPGNTHLHFGIALARPDEAWHEGRDIDPYPLLAGAGAPR